MDDQIRRLGQPVEVEREVVRREDLTERHRRQKVRDGADESVVDVQLAQRAVDEAAERIVAGSGDDCTAPAVPRGGDGHVRRAAAEELAERCDVLETDPDLQRVQVDAHAADRDHVEVAFHGSA